MNLIPLPKMKLRKLKELKKLRKYSLHLTNSRNSISFSKH